MKDFKLLMVARELWLKVDKGKIHGIRYEITLTREITKILKELP